MTDTSVSAPALDTSPDDARVWIYATASTLSDAAAQAIDRGLVEFFRAWRSHGRIVRGAAGVFENRVIVVVAHIDGGDISGCGIDQHVRVLDGLLSEHGAALADVLTVVYRDRSGLLRTASRPEFRRLREAGEVSGILQRNATTFGEVRRGLVTPLG